MCGEARLADFLVASVKPSWDDLLDDLLDDRSVKERSSAARRASLATPSRAACSLRASSDCLLDPCCERVVFDRFGVVGSHVAPLLYPSFGDDDDDDDVDLWCVTWSSFLLPVGVKEDAAALAANDEDPVPNLAPPGSASEAVAALLCPLGLLSGVFPLPSRGPEMDSIALLPRFPLKSRLKRGVVSGSLVADRRSEERRVGKECRN